jgi:pyruvate/oxaloacetate carboxyltransferase
VKINVKHFLQEEAKTENKYQTKENVLEYLLFPIHAILFLEIIWEETFLPQIERVKARLSADQPTQNK